MISSFASLGNPNRSVMLLFPCACRRVADKKNRERKIKSLEDFMMF